MEKVIGNHSCVLGTKTHHRALKRDDAGPPRPKGVSRTSSSSPLKPDAVPWL